MPRFIGRERETGLEIKAISEVVAERRQSGDWRSQESPHPLSGQPVAAATKELQQAQIAENLELLANFVANMLVCGMQSR